MKNSTILILTAIILILLFLFRKPINKITMPRGLRNNNPGNIRKTFDSKGKQTFWKNEIAGKDPYFKTFETMADGYRALFALLLEYRSKGFDTITKIINRYAPSNENNTNAYINVVSQKTGIDPHSVIDYSDSNNFKDLVAAISLVENGQKADREEINEGYAKLG
jgi:hypothetical protein